LSIKGKSWGRDLRGKKRLVPTTKLRTKLPHEIRKKRRKKGIPSATEGKTQRNLDRKALPKRKGRKRGALRAERKKRKLAQRGLCSTKKKEEELLIPELGEKGDTPRGGSHAPPVVSTRRSCSLNRREGS